MSTSTTAARGVVLAPAAPLPPEQLAALRAFARDGPTQLPRDVTTHVHSEGDDAVVAGDAGMVRAQLRAARVAATRLARLAHLETAGYYLGSYFVPGVGVHYIDWRRVGAPFDPARPAMLLVDATRGHRVRLAGFSYWVRSATPPAGFDGDADVWHQHRGLCFVDGLLTSDGVASTDGCDGTWLNGRGLWMLHVWVVPGYPNDDGVFAETNAALCPPRTGPETSWC